jgi:hypothetical protein
MRASCRNLGIALPSGEHRQRRGIFLEVIGRVELPLAVRRGDAHPVLDVAAGLRDVFGGRLAVVPRFRAGVGVGLGRQAKAWCNRAASGFRCRRDRENRCATTPGSAPGSPRSSRPRPASIDRDHRIHPEHIAAGHHRIDIREPRVGPIEVGVEIKARGHIQGRPFRQIAGIDARDRCLQRDRPPLLILAKDFRIANPLRSRRLGPQPARKGQSCGQKSKKAA